MTVHLTARYYFLYLVEGPVRASDLHRQTVHSRLRVPTTMPLCRRADEVRVRNHPQLRWLDAVLRPLVDFQGVGWKGKGQR